MTAPPVPPVPPGAEEVFGARLPSVRRYVEWLAGPGVSRGLLGPREVPRLWERHVLNSVAVAPLIPPDSVVLDVGSGAGLPGIPLALARPDLRVTLVEPLLRRSTFLAEVCRDLGLPEVVVLRARGEECPVGEADVVVARAVAPLERLARLTVPLLREGGRLVALKGQGAQAETDQAQAALRALRVRSVRVVEVPVPGSADPTRAVVVVAGGGAAKQ